MEVYLLDYAGRVHKADTRDIELGEKRLQDNGYYSSVIWVTEDNERIHQADIKQVAKDNKMLDLAREEQKRTKARRCLFDFIRRKL